MRRSFRTRRMLLGQFPGLHPGLVCDAPSGHGIRNRIRSFDLELVDIETEMNRIPPKKRSERCSAPRPGSATPATEEKRKLGKLKAEIEENGTVKNRKQKVNAFLNYAFFCALCVLCGSLHALWGNRSEKVCSKNTLASGRRPKKSARSLRTHASSATWISSLFPLLPQRLQRRSFLLRLRNG